MTRRCACCGKPFAPRPQVPDQACCAAPDCQRARKRQWQRAKLQSDPDYRSNQRAAQQARSVSATATVMIRCRADSAKENAQPGAVGR
jgi:hypothetical protein